MYIPTVQEFKCFVDGKELTVDVSLASDVMFKINIDMDACVLIKDPEQIATLRDMLTVWLSRER